MRSLVAITLAAALLATACSRHPDDEHGDSSARRPVDGADIRIVTTTSELDLALVGDTISAGLAPHALAKARRETDSATVSGSGLGPSIERLVKGTVQTAVSTRVSFPVSAVKAIRYRDGAIEFEWSERPTRLFEQTKVNGKPFLASFPPDDARRFVDAVRGRIATNQ